MAHLRFFEFFHFISTFNTALCDGQNVLGDTRLKLFILQFGSKKIFDGSEPDIVYDDVAVDKILDRSQEDMAVKARKLPLCRVKL